MVFGFGTLSAGGSPISAEASDSTESLEKTFEIVDHGKAEEQDDSNDSQNQGDTFVKKLGILAENNEKVDNENAQTKIDDNSNSDKILTENLKQPWNIRFFKLCVRTIPFIWTMCYFLILHKPNEVSTKYFGLYFSAFTIIIRIEMIPSVSQNVSQYMEPLDFFNCLLKSLFLVFWSFMNKYPGHFEYKDTSSSYNDKHFAICSLIVLFIELMGELTLIDYNMRVECKLKEFLKIPIGDPIRGVILADRDEKLAKISKFLRSKSEIEISFAKKLSLDGTLAIGFFLFSTLSDLGKPLICYPTCFFGLVIFNNICALVLKPINKLVLKYIQIHILEIIRDECEEACQLYLEEYYEKLEAEANSTEKTFQIIDKAEEKDDAAGSQSQNDTVFEEFDIMEENDEMDDDGQPEATTRVILYSNYGNILTKSSKQPWNIRSFKLIARAIPFVFSLFYFIIFHEPDVVSTKYYGLYFAGYTLIIGTEMIPTISQKVSLYMDEPVDFFNYLLKSIFLVFVYFVTKTGQIEDEETSSSHRHKENFGRSLAFFLIELFAELFLLEWNMRIESRYWAYRKTPIFSPIRVKIWADREEMMAIISEFLNKMSKINNRVASIMSLIFTFLIGSLLFHLLSALDMNFICYPICFYILAILYNMFTKKFKKLTQRDKNETLKILQEVQLFDSVFAISGGGIINTPVID